LYFMPLRGHAGSRSQRTALKAAGCEVIRAASAWHSPRSLHSTQRYMVYGKTW
jgi:hypothetical protein